MNNDFYRQIVESLEDYAVLTTDIGGRITSWNSGAENILGYKKAEVIGQDAAVLFILEDRQKGKPAAELKTALKKGRAKDEKWHRRKDGSIFWGSGLVFPLKDEADVVTGFTKVMRDLTAQRLAEEEKQKNVEILESIGDAFFALDSDWNFTFVNTQMEKIVLKTRRELIGNCIWDIFPEAAKVAFGEQYHKVIRDQKPVQFEEYYAPLGVWLSVHAYPAKDGLSVYFTDVTQRKQAEEQQRYQKTLMEAQQEVSPEGILVVSAQGDMVSHNRQFAKMWHFPEKIIGAKLDTLALQAAQEQLVDPEAFIKRVIELYETRQKSQEKLYFKDGRVFERYGSPIVGDNDTNYGYVWFFRDVSDQEKSEKALQASEERFKLVAGVTNDAIWDWDIKTNDLWWSDGIQALFGYPRKSITPVIDWWYDHIHPEDRKRVLNSIHAAIDGSGETIWSSDYRFLKKDGSHAFVNDKGYVMRDADGVGYRMLGAMVDTTAEAESRRKLQESEERLRFMAESMPQKIFTARADGSIDYFNPQWMEFTGLTFEQIRDWGWTQFIHPDDVDENVRRWKHSIKTGEPFEMEHRFRQADGQYCWHLSRAHALKNKHGATIMWIGSNTDIDDFRRTTQRKLELEDITAVLRQQQAQLVALNDAKDEFIALASHQLRTPATGVKQYAGMLLEGYAGEITAPQRDMLERVYDSNERQLTIVNDLLQVARVDAGKVKLARTTFDVASVIADVLQEQTERFSQRHQNLVFIQPKKALIVNADKGLLRMVLENLIDNAGKYSPVGKAITVRLKQTTKKTEIDIVDQGVGICKKDQARLFQKFARIDNPLSAEVGGSGPGLYWAKQIIDLHDGKLEVASESKAGSTFSIVLPYGKDYD